MNKKLTVNNLSIQLLAQGNSEYISLTDMARFKDLERTNYIIQNWMRTRYTIDFIGLWEQLYNPHFKGIEFDAFKNQAGLNSFTLTPQRWVEATRAIGIVSRSGRYGGTFAHRDIAFEFATWLSPTFKLYLIKEYQRLKEVETTGENLEWSVRRILSKVNYLLQTDAVKKHILPKFDFFHQPDWVVYAEEADLLNVALFGCTAKQWREANPELVTESKNVRDYANINQLAVLSNLETHNAEMIKSGLKKADRFNQLVKISAYQIKIFEDQDFLKLVTKKENMSSDIIKKDNSQIQ